MQVRELMSRQVVTIGTGDSCLEAVTRMQRSRVRHLPVVSREGLLVGIVTDRDLRHHLFTPRLFEALGSTPVDVLLLYCYHYDPATGKYSRGAMTFVRAGGESPQRAGGGNVAASCAGGNRRSGRSGASHRHRLEHSHSGRDRPEPGGHVSAARH